MIKKEFFLFLLVGLAQLAIDAGLLVCFVKLMGLGAWTNILSRGLAATFGYVANTKLSFSHRTQSRLSGRQALRYFLTWATLTLMGTALIKLCQLWFSSSDTWILLAAKLTSELILVFLSFSAFRLWVYRQ